MCITPSAPVPEATEAPTETITATTAELNGSPAKPLTKTMLSNALAEASTFGHYC